MKVLLFGKNGQVGTALQDSLNELGSLISVGRNDKGGDFLKPDEVVALIQQIKPDVIVNATAYNDVNGAETNDAQARIINADTVGEVAKLAAQLDALFIHYSTDYVFDGASTLPYIESDKPNPLGAYGRSKYEGEQLVAASGCHYMIFRTSWVFSATRDNFLKKILTKIVQNQHITIASQQVGVPSSAAFIAQVTADIIPCVLKDKSKCGLYHLVPDGQVTRYDYATEILRFYQRSYSTTSRIYSEQAESNQPDVAERPVNCVLNNRKLKQTFNIDFPEWIQCVEDVVNELNNNIAQQDERVSNI